MLYTPTRTGGWSSLKMYVREQHTYLSALFTILTPEMITSKMSTCSFCSSCLGFSKMAWEETKAHPEAGGWDMSDMQKPTPPFNLLFTKKGHLLPFRSLLEVLWLSWWGRHRILERTVGQTGKWQKKAKFKKVLIYGLVIYMQDI